MMLGDDERQLVGPRLAAGLLQPYILRLDRRHEVVERFERGEVVERCRDRELVVAVGYVWGECAGEVHHAVYVRFVGVVAGIIATGKVAVRLEDLLGQRDASENLGRHHHGTIVRLVSVFGVVDGNCTTLGDLFSRLY